MKSKITIFLCLKDRAEYTKSWISNNLYSDYEYLVADGSNENNNYDIFKNINRKNLKYIKYPYDKDINTYILKVIDALNKIETPYVIRVDNDDIILKEGIDSCVEKLENNNKFGIAQGNIRSIFMKNSTIKNPKYKIVPNLKKNFKDLINLNSPEAIDKAMSPYRSVWYAVYKTNIYKRIWTDILKSKIVDIFLIEYLQTQLALIYSNLLYLNKNYYLRLSNPVTSTTLENQTLDFPNWQRVYFDEEYRKELYKMINFISKKLNYDENWVINVYRKMYSGFAGRERLRTMIFKGISYFVLKSLTSFSPYMNANKIKKIFNYLNI
jgi:glycosyltransferase domain-containing protein